MKKNWPVHGSAALLALALLFALFSALSPRPGTSRADPEPPRKARIYHKGRKAPPPAKLAALHRDAKARVGDRIKRLPLATLSQYDCRTLSIVPPIEDQGQCGSCFVGDTMIRMADGTYKRIDQVRVSDLVVSAEGNVCPVTRTMKRQVNDNLSHITISGHYQLEATREHPILTEDGYIKIGDLLPGQFVAIPRFLPGDGETAVVDGRLDRPLTDESSSFPFGETIDDPVPRVKLTRGLGRLLGLYIAEGSASGFDRKVIWSFSIKEADTFAAEVVRLCRSELDAEAKMDLRPEVGGCKVSINSASLSRQFLAWFGSGPENKTVPACFMSANREFLAGMLSGWMDGDRQRGESAVTVSPILAMQMHDVANYLGFMPSLLVHTEPKTDSRGVNHLRSWRVGLNNPATYKRGAARMTDTHLWRKVTFVENGRLFTGNVYNLEVEGDHSYVANGVGVHNCWDFSGTGVVDCALIKGGFGRADGSFALSEQYTLDCGTNGGCDGDDNTTVLAWAKATGLPLSSAYGSYTATAGSCGSTPSMKLYKIADWGYCTPDQQQGVATTQDIKNAMVQYGPIGCAIAADDAFCNNPAGTVFDTTTSTGIDHDIVLVGWDDNKGKNGSWILRNSWGTSWCDNGYIRIGYGVNLVGTEAVWATAAPLPPVPPTPPPGPPVPPGPAPANPVVSVTVTFTDGSTQVIGVTPGPTPGPGMISVTKETTLAQILQALAEKKAAR